MRADLGFYAVRVVLVLVTVVVIEGPKTAEAAVPTTSQQRCINALYTAGNQIAAATCKEMLACVRRFSKGKAMPGETLDHCVAADASRAIARARAHADQVETQRCVTPPDFGPQGSDAVRSGYGALVDLHGFLGKSPEGAIVRAAVDRQAARCQQTALVGLVDLASVRSKVFSSCVRAGLRSGSISSAADLGHCLNTDANVKVLRATEKLRVKIARRCRSTAIADVVPGHCVGATTDTLGACIDRRVGCDVCLAVARAGDVGVNCQPRINGVTACQDRPITGQSVARLWDEEILEAIRHDTPRPTVHARNLYHLSAAMWDAWRAYGGGGSAVLRDERLQSDDPEVDREIAISFAAYRILSHRYALSVNAAVSQHAFDARMAALDLDASFTDATGDSPASVGNRIAAAVIAYGAGDGANEQGNYADPSYVPVNDPLIVKLGAPTMSDPNRWQPLALDFFQTQNGIPLPDKVQTAIGTRWNQVAPFALTRASPEDVYIDPGPPPQLGTATDTEFKEAAVRVVQLSSELTPDDGEMIDISPGTYGNNPLGTNDGEGHAVNPVTATPYAPQVVKRGDFGRVLAEFWADGPSSETPPGHWNVIANYVSDHLAPTTKRLGGAGPVLGSLEWDVKLYLALNGAVHDAAITAWGLKRKYDSVRPISMIRYMGSLGQSSDPFKPSFHASGLPLRDGLIELITFQTTQPGGRHQNLVGQEGKVAVLAWPGQPADASTTYRGVQWIKATSWVPYQKNTFVTPAFPGYISGHSTFSRAAAEVLTAFSGSAFFPGGLGEFVAHANQYLTFEVGPTTDVRLQWATYYDAADQAGQSRLWGGIHIAPDDFRGRIAGSQVGMRAFEKAKQYFAGP